MQRIKKVVALGLGLLSLSGPAWAITRADATRKTPPDAEKDFEESLVKPDGIGQGWNGVGQLLLGFPAIPGTGVLISDRHVLTAAHGFFDPFDGTGPQRILPAGVQFRLDGVAETFRASAIHIAPGYTDADGNGRGHRLVGFDLAVITLERPVPGATVYAYNTGQIADERNPLLTTIKVGFGKAGNGELGSVGTSGKKREMFNRVDQFGDGRTTWHTPFPGSRNEPPPLNTLVYDFDRLDESNSTGLRNFFDEEFNGAVIPTEGSPASGDSGGPLFQFDANNRPIIVGITSSGSDDQARFGIVDYDTRVRSYQGFIAGVLALPEPSSLVFFGLGGAGLAGVAWRRRGCQKRK